MWPRQTACCRSWCQLRYTWRSFQADVLVPSHVQTHNVALFLNVLSWYYWMSQHWTRRMLSGMWYLALWRRFEVACHHYLPLFLCRKVGYSAFLKNTVACLLPVTADLPIECHSSVLAVNVLVSTLFSYAERIVRFCVFTAVTMNNAVFWNMTPCTVILQDSAAFITIMLHGWFDDVNDGTRIFWYVGTLTSDYTASRTVRQPSSTKHIFGDVFASKHVDMHLT